MFRNQRLIKAMFFPLLAVGLFLFGKIALAQDVGLNEINNVIQLSSDNPLRIVSRIVNIAMMFLGAIAVIFILIAGFKWMTSNGNEEKITEAKKVLRNGIIGLLIILSAWGITFFILNRLMRASGNGGDIDNGSGGKNINPGLGLGALGSCSVDSVYPEPGQKGIAKNTAILITFKEELKLDTICVNDSGTACACDNTSNCQKINPASVKIYESTIGDKEATNIKDALVNQKDNKTLIISLPGYFPVTSDGVWFTVRLTSEIKKADNSSMFSTCSSDYLAWEFAIDNKIDLTPPQVLSAGIFPEPDNQADKTESLQSAKSAMGSFTVLSLPQTFQAATLKSVANNPPSSQGWPNSLKVTMDRDYHGSTESFKVTILSGNRAQLFSDSSLGIFNINNGEVNFPGYFLVKFDGFTPTAGNSWSIEVNPEIRADNISIGQSVYTFVASAAGAYEILRATNLNDQADNIASVLSGRDDIEASSKSSKAIIRFKASGEAGNNLVLATNNSNNIAVSGMAGGQDEKISVTVGDKQDKPMNSIIQINFSEPINPMTVSGSSDEVKNTIRVINLADNNAPVAGRWLISNNYRTLEFQSTTECGMNGCGEKIYCLPPSAHLQVELVAAALNPCTSSGDCSAFAPYNSCGASKVCQNSANKNYPLALKPLTAGIVDAAFNSLNGNRDESSDGPLSFYDENVRNPNFKDSYRFSFFVTDRLEASAPQITNIVPAPGLGNVDLSNPIIIDFNKMMMQSTLRTGSIKTPSGTSTVDHKMINLFNKTNQPVGYWITSQNIDLSPVDGRYDMTRATINHSLFDEAINYSAQAGSGIKDIYQNCFKPSSGPGCVASEENPSCCNGQASTLLTPDGNCP